MCERSPPRKAYRRYQKASFFSLLAALAVPIMPLTAEELNSDIINERIEAGFANIAAVDQTTIVIGEDGVAQTVSEADSKAISITKTEGVDRPDLSLLVGSRHTTGVDELAQNTKTYQQAEIVEAIRTESQRMGVDPNFALLIAEIESKFDQFALSEDGAMGIMQLMPATAKDLGVKNPWDALENVRGGVFYLSQLFAEFSDPVIVAAAYHSGAEAVRQKQGIPDGPRTAQYVVRVLNDYVQVFGKSHPSTTLDRVKVASVAQRKQPIPTRTEAWDSNMVLHLD
jgi:soluble lytic murein transglycosylase-like protein